MFSDVKTQVFLLVKVKFYSVKFCESLSNGAAKQTKICMICNQEVERGIRMQLQSALKMT